MRKYFLFVVTGVCACAGLTAQTLKFGHVNVQEVVALMPERDSAESRLMRYVNDLEKQVETMQVEYNKKLNDYQKSAKTMSDLIREQKEKELQELGGRIQEFQATAQQDLQQQRTEFFRPVIEKANAAIKKIAAEGKFTYVFDISSSAVTYYDPAQSTDIMDLVRKELNITKELPPRK